MATIIRGETDAAVQALKDALDEYETQHPGAEAALYRQNSGSIRIRVIDRRFEGMSKSRRHDHVWTFLESRADEEAMSDISLLLTLPPAELGSNFANFEFENPLPSKL